jgi:hypothetical protein
MHSAVPLAKTHTWPLFVGTAPTAASRRNIHSQSFRRRACVDPLGGCGKPAAEVGHELRRAAWYASRQYSATRLAVGPREQLASIIGERCSNLV